MAIAHLLKQPVTIQHVTITGTDALGNEVQGVDSDQNIDTLGYVEQTAAAEVTVDRQTYTTDWLVILPSDVTVGARDRIVSGAVTLEIVGPPSEAWNPIAGAVDHIECRCRYVTG